jgi:hypothetical protein
MEVSVKKAVCAVLAAGLLAVTVPPVFGQRANFGSYPAGFKIWEGANQLVPAMNAFVEQGYAKSPTVRELFGQNAPFAVVMKEGDVQIPVSVTIEASSGNGNEFSATLLLSVHLSKNETKQALRMQVRFRADTVAEKSYITYLRLVNLLTNKAQESRSSGNYLENFWILGNFIGSMDMFWDTAKLGKNAAQTAPDQIPGSNIFLNNLSKEDVDNILTGTVFDVFTKELKPNDYNTELKRKTFLNTDKGKEYQKRLEEAQNRLRSQGIKTIQRQTAPTTNVSVCSISDYDINRGGFEITLEGGPSMGAFSPDGRRFGPSVNGFIIPNLEFTAGYGYADVASGLRSTPTSNYWTTLFIPVPEAAAAKIERNQKVCVQLQLAFDTFELQKVFLLNEETNEVYAEAGANGTRP